MNAESLIALNEEIAGMARAGLPLDQGLSVLAREMGRGRLREVTAAIAEDLRTGQTLPEALKRQSGRVPPFYASLVSAGIRTGRISEVLATLTTYARAIANLRLIVVDAFFYPCVVLFFAAVLFTGASLFIVPQFNSIFTSFQMSLPIPTRIMLEISERPISTVVVPVTGLIVGFFLLRLIMNWTDKGRSYWARMMYVVPIVGTLIRSARLAAFTDLLAILVDHELPLPEAFYLAGASSSDPVMTAAVREIEQELQEGRPLGEALRGRGLVPEWVSWMIRLGENRGTLGKTLHQIAETYRRQAEVRASFLKSVLPPFLVICTAGLFAVFFVFALMLPMTRLLEGLSK
jgi:type II secretory pathway component PulF